MSLQLEIVFFKRTKDECQDTDLRHLTRYIQLAIVTHVYLSYMIHGLNYRTWLNRSHVIPARFISVPNLPNRAAAALSTLSLYRRRTESVNFRTVKNVSNNEDISKVNTNGKTM